MKKYYCLLLILILTFAAAVSEAQVEHLIQGRTMGTIYRVKVVSSASVEISGLKKKIESRLGEINLSISNYMAESEISQFNSLQQTGVRFKISKDFYQFMRVAKKFYQLSD